MTLTRIWEIQQIKRRIASTIYWTTSAVTVPDRCRINGAVLSSIPVVINEKLRILLHGCLQVVF